MNNEEIMINETNEEVNETANEVTAYEPEQTPEAIESQNSALADFIATCLKVGIPVLVAIGLYKNQDKIKAWHGKRKAKKMAKLIAALEEAGYVVTKADEELEYVDAVDDEVEENVPEKTEYEE